MSIERLQAAPQPVAGERDWSPYAIYTLAILTVISAFNYLDRGILGLALPLIKRQMHVSDTALGLVSGLAFAIFYSLLGLPIAWLAERSSRRNIIAVGLALWSVMTALTGFVANVWQLGIARFLMGAGEACGIAPSNSMLADVFREARRPLALALYTMSASLAYIVFYPLAGWVGGHYGWRAMFVVCGVPGMILALVLLLTVKEPHRQRQEAGRVRGEAYSLAEAVRFLLGSRAFLLILLGATFMGASVYASSTWNAAFLMRVHHMSIAAIGASIGPIQGTFWGVGILLGGILTDVLGRRDARWRLRLPAVACLLTGPSEVLFLLGRTRPAWMVGLALTSLFMLAHQGPVFAAAMSVARVRMRAVAIAMLVLASGLLGQIAGPLLVGALNDRLQAVFGGAAVRYSLMSVACCTVAAGLSFWLALGYFGRDRLRAEQAAPAEVENLK